MSKTTITENDIRLTAYAVGEMDGDEKQQFERLLADSPEAQAEVQAIRALSENLSSEFERELAAEGGEQPFVSIPLSERGETTGTGDAEDSGKVLRPRFWVFGSVAAGLAATGMVAVYTLQDTSFERQGKSGDMNLVAVVAESGAGNAPAAVAWDEADVSELSYGDARQPADMLVAVVSDREGAKDSRRVEVAFKRDVSGPAQVDEKAAGSLALGPAKEAAPGKKSADMDGESGANTSSGRSVVTLPSADGAAAEKPALFARAKSGAANEERGSAVGGNECRGHRLEI